MKMASDGENEISLMDKYKKLSEHVIVLERKLMAMENLQLLIKEKDEEIKRLGSMTDQYKLRLLGSKQHLTKTSEITEKEYGSCVTTDANERVQTHISEGHKGVQNQSEDVLRDVCEPVGLQDSDLLGIPKCVPILPSQIQNIGSKVKSKPFTFAPKYPVSRDLVDKLMQQNARLKKALREVLLSRHSVESRCFQSDIPTAPESDAPMDSSKSSAHTFSNSNLCSPISVKSEKD